GDEYREIHTLLFGGTTPAPETTTPPTRTAPPEVDFSGLDIPGPNEEPKTPDHIIIRNLRKRSRHGRALWRGDTRGYPSPSEADAALMVMLADACDYNIYQMERLFLQSGLAKRDKAQNRPDYIRRTAIHAIQYVYCQNAAMEIKRSHAPRWRRPHPNNFGEARIRVTQGGRKLK
ncbi:MAG: hypothetical protein MJ014_04395, partial [Methanocorpusculum sp.]|nr:hypothetical protein [Methanocorpusculum sp.]